MKITAIIDSYNYVSYLEAAIQSVLDQTRKPDELIVVDDGSSDGSLELAEKMLAEVSWARVVSKENGGQLSCITRGIVEATGDILAFLDCDDVWRNDHLEKAISHFEEHPELSLYFTAYECFNAEGVIGVKSRGYASGLIGRTLATTAAGKSYVGAVNSALVARASYLKPYLPLPAELEKDWVINADNIIVWITSLSGGLKYSSTEPTLRYRIHGANQTIEAKKAKSKTHREIARMRLFKHFDSVFYIPLDIPKALYKELRAHQCDKKELKKEYVKALTKNAERFTLCQYWWLKLKLASCS